MKNDCTYGLLLTLEAVNAGVISARFAFHAAPRITNGFLPNSGSNSLLVISPISLSWKFLKYFTKISLAKAGDVTKICGDRLVKIPTKLYLGL